MERLTYDFCVGNTHCWQVKGADNALCKNVCIEQGDNGCKECPIKKAFDRLAAYEDTGLGPEEVVQTKLALMGKVLAEIKEFEGIPIERMRELAQAEKKGRLVVLPCKVGDTVYHITTCEHFPQVLDGTMYGDDGGPGTATGRYCPYELAEKCPFVEDFDCNKTKNKLAVFEDEIVSFYIDDSGISIGLCYSGFVNVLDFGETVFLTRKEAEAALKKRKANHEQNKN